MREIKFRVRDKITKELLGNEHFNVTLNNGYYYTDLRKPIDDGGGGVDYICESEFSEQPMLKPNNPLSGLLREQYTGLKDKNGVEIYEGDIVTDSYCNLNVDYSKYGAVSMGYIHDSDGWANGKTYGWVSSSGSSLADLEECVVIGNIHENPELLESKND